MIVVAGAAVRRRNVFNDCEAPSQKAEAWDRFAIHEFDNESFEQTFTKQAGSSLCEWPLRLVREP